MKKGKNFLRMLVLAGIITSLGFMQFGYAQPVKKPFPKPPKSLGVWKIIRFYTEPACYTKLPHKETKIIINTIFECKGPKGSICKPLTIKAYWVSSIDRGEKKINLTEAIKSTCGPHVSACTVMWDGEPMKVTIAPRRYTTSTVYYISPRLTGNIKFKIEAYTGVKLTDSKRLIIKPCSKEQPRPGIKPDLIIEKFQMPETVTVKKGEYADLKINLTIKNIGRASAGASYADIQFSPAPPGRAVRHRKSVPALNPGEIYILNFYVRIAPRNYRVCAIADSTHVVAESNEGNNKTCRSLSVRGR